MYQNNLIYKGYRLTAKVARHTVEVNEAAPSGPFIPGNRFGGSGRFHPGYG